VLSASTFSREGGIQRVTQMVLRVLRDAWPENPVELFSLHDQAAGPVHPAFAAAREAGKFVYRPFASARLRYTLAVLAALATTRSALVLSDHAHLNILPWLARPLSRFRWASFVHLIELATLGALRRRTLRGADRVLAVSELAAGEAGRVLGPGLPLEVCLLGLCPEYPAWAAARPPAPAALAGRRPIVIVGRMATGGRDKGHEDLLRALPAVRRRVPEALLVIVGRGGDQPRLRRLADELGLAGHVHFAGMVPDPLLPAYYEAAEVFAMPSRAEGFGLVYLEAMYHGKPCVAGTRDAAGEVVRDGVTGLLVEPGNVGQLEAALLRPLEDREAAARMGRAGRARLDAHFTFEHFADRLKAALARLEPRLGMPGRPALKNGRRGGAAA
jgi:glycosyltransferase involved in cell wall biosynthesis